MAVPTAGLIAHYTMDNITSTTLVDETGMYDGVIVGAVPTTGYSGDALNFNGSSYIDTSIPSIDGDFTVSLWINVPNDNAGGRVFDWRGNGSGGTVKGLQLKSFFSGNIALIDDGAGNMISLGSVDGIPNFSNSKFQHILVTWDNTAKTLAVYVAGVLGASETNAALGSINGPYNAFLGTNANIPGNQSLIGLVDIFRLYNRVLTQSEITELAFEDFVAPSGIVGKLTTAPYNATHLWMCHDTTQEITSSGVDNTNQLALTISTSIEPSEGICGGVDNALRTSTDPTRGIGASTANTSDINESADIFRKRTVMMWVKMVDIIADSSSIYEQGGSLNNFAFSSITGSITWQTADGGQPFLIAKSTSPYKTLRPVLISGVWEHHTEHAGSGNRIILIINGVTQEIVENTGTDVFPQHTGDVSIGNTADFLQTYGGGTMGFNQWRKWINMFTFINDFSISDIQSREIFEETVLPEVTIVADTELAQQTALDLLIGNNYTDVNCAIRIMQTTDAVNPRLFIDNVTFKETTDLQDISVQWVGSGTLTLENANGSNTLRTNSPIEVNTVYDTVVPGGGSVIEVLDTIRLHTVTDQLNVSAQKMVFTISGTYNLTNVVLNEVENVSGGSVLINAIGSTVITTNLGLDITITAIATFIITGLIAGSIVELYDNEIVDNGNNNTKLTSITNSGTTFSYTHNGATNDIRVQVIADNYEEIIQDFTLSNVDQSLAIIPVLDTND